MIAPIDRIAALEGNDFSDLRPWVQRDRHSARNRRHASMCRPPVRMRDARASAGTIPKSRDDRPKGEIASASQAAKYTVSPLRQRSSSMHPQYNLQRAPLQRSNPGASAYAKVHPRLLGRPAHISAACALASLAARSGILASSNASSSSPSANNRGRFAVAKDSKVHALCTYSSINLVRNTDPGPH